MIVPRSLVGFGLTLATSRLSVCASSGQAGHQTPGTAGAIQVITKRGPSEQ